MTSNPASAPPTPGRPGRPRTGPRRGVRRSDAWLAAALAALLPLTVWQVGRSEALTDARAAYEGRPAPLNLHTLWEAARRAWADAGRPAPGVGATGRPDHRLALRRALDHLDRHPRDPEAARIAARCLTALDFAPEAEPYYTVARAGGALAPDDLSARALGLARGNHREPAIAAYEEILARRPDDADALQRLATLYYSQTRLKQALETAERLAKAPGGAVAGNALIGIVCHDDHKLDRAIRAFEKVLELSPDLSGLALPASLFYQDLAQDLLDAGRPADARRHLLRALSSQNDPALMSQLGKAYKREGQDEEAVRCWKTAAEWDPQLAGPWLNLGLYALERNRIDEAVGALEKASALDGAALEPTYQLGLAYRRAGRPADADRCRKQAERIRQAQATASRPKGLLTDDPP
jgi:tetratricopeptide (TPR) repeat protein